MIYRWIVTRDGIWHLQGRRVRDHFRELGRIEHTSAGYLWETADGRWGDTEGTLERAMRALERQVRA